MRWQRNFAIVKPQLKHIVLATSALAAPCALAGGTATPDSVSLPEVTVTAIKQSSNLRTQPTALTVLDRGDVERAHVESVKTAAQLVPNLWVPDYGSRMTSTIYVRGLGARIDQPSMGLNIDNVPIMCKESYDFAMSDITRVEMLRGPQSTLYGRNTMGGVMNIYTRSPWNNPGTSLTATYASHNTWQVSAGHYAKVSHKLGLSAQVGYSASDGEFRNAHTGKKVDWDKQVQGRIKAEWMPSPTLWVSNVAWASYSRQGGYPYRYTGTGAIAYNDTCFYRRTIVADGLTVRKNWEHLSLSSISSWQYLRDNMTLDQDFTTDDYFTLTQARHENALTEDLVLRTHDLGSYNGLVGAFGFYRHYNMQAPVTFYDTGIANLIENNRNKYVPAFPISWDERTLLLGSDFRSTTWGAALYHSSTLELGRWSLTAGLRLEWEKATLDYHNETHSGYSIIEAATGSIYSHENIDIVNYGKLSKDFLQLLPKLQVTYSLRGNSWETVFASVSKGSKAGGFNTQMFSDVLQQQLMGYMGIGAAYDVDQIVGYKPEKAWNYELGMHMECWQRRVKNELTLFYVDCRDRQLTVFPDGVTTGRVMTNAGRTRSLGIEVSSSIEPQAGTGLSVAYGYCNATFRRYNDGKADYRGKHVPYSPEHTLTAEAHHTITLDAANSLRLAADTKAAGRIWWDEANTVSQPFYAQLGASATWQAKHCSLELWGRNLTGTKFNTFYFVSIGHEFLQQGHGRSLGATLRIDI